MSFQFRMSFREGNNEGIAARQFRDSRGRGRCRAAFARGPVSAAMPGITGQRFAFHGFSFRKNKQKTPPGGAPASIGDWF
jgi:hypothetical protein